MPDSAAPEQLPTRDLRKTGIDPEHWYPLLRSRALKRGAAVGVSFAGEPIVLVRTETGAVFALEDRCAHRQVPLHAGVVAGERLQCCYHGWTYDCTGRCVNVPYLRGRTLPNGVRSYPCREDYGLIFVKPGGADPDGGFPDIPVWRDRRYRTRYLDRRVACHYSFMHENLMDMNHQFLHRRLMGRIKARVLDVRNEAGRVAVDYTFSRTAGRRNIGERFMVGRQRTDGGSGRDHDLMTIATEYPYQVLTYRSAGSDEPALVLWNVYVPVDREQRQNHTFGLMMIRRPPIPGLVHLMWPFIVWFTEGIFAEDRWVVEEEQKAFDRQGADHNREVSPVILALRELLRERGIAMEAAN